jgi:hypothetical protein
MMVKIITERSTSAPIPNATATAWVKAPAVLPATVVTPARRPSASARPMVNSTLGPGTTISAQEVRVKATRCEVGSTLRA